MSSNKPKNREFQELTARINDAIQQNEGLIGDQKAQVELVISLEEKFKYFIQKPKQIISVYAKFIHFITQENGNILSARPYFRERSDVFSKHITKAIRNNKPEDLMRFSINYQLIDFIVSNWEGPLPERAERYYKEFIEARRILIENNLPLAINKAKIFYKKTPRSHITLLDFINICTLGLVSGVDKYVGDYDRVWGSVSANRMKGYMIEEYSKTFLRMYPTDKKILYRANKLKYQMKIESIEELTEVVNESFEKDKSEGKKVPKLPITEVHIRTLLNGTSYVSADSKVGENGEDDEDGVNIYDCTASSDNVEENVGNKQMFTQVKKAASNLQIIEKKVIKLKGVEL